MNSLNVLEHHVMLPNRPLLHNRALALLRRRLSEGGIFAEIFVLHPFEAPLELIKLSLKFDCLVVGGTARQHAPHCQDL